MESFEGGFEERRKLEKTGKAKQCILRDERAMGILVAKCRKDGLRGPQGSRTNVGSVTY